MSGSNVSDFKNLPVLPDWAVKELESQAETGMQYQTGDVTLKDSSVIRDVVFVGSKYISEVKGYETVPVDPKDIRKIQLTHKKWKFR